MMILPTAYLAPETWYKAFFEADNVQIEVQESFVKQTFRNRCLIHDIQGHEVTLTVSDNGRGIQRGTVSGEGMGLQNIRERIESYNGRLDIVSAESKGTDINIILPL